MTPSRSQARILVVDDDPGLQHAVQRILGRHYEVVCASNPDEAKSLTAKLRPELAILDIYMPEMNGFELMRLLRRVRADLDVIMMTGDTAEADSNLIRAIEADAFYFVQKPFDRRVLLALVSRCLERRRLRTERQLHLRRMESELKEAQQFQLSFLPPPLARLGGLHIAARYAACQELAGDFYDYALTNGRGVSLLVADVVGHGASAAMMTGVVKSAFHAAHGDDYSPASVIEHLRGNLRVFDDSRFVTVFCARFDPPSRRLEYANAGHPPAILRRRDGSWQLLEATGPIVCAALADVPFTHAGVDLTPGDTLLIYTDGMAEAAGGGEMFGHGRIRSLVANSRRTGAALLEQMMQELARFTNNEPYDDDVTILSVDAMSE